MNAIDSEHGHLPLDSRLRIACALGAACALVPIASVQNRFSVAERESDPDKIRRLLTFVIVGGGPTGVELAGALAEIARQSLRDDFRRIHPEQARILLIEGSPHLLGAFPDPLRGNARTTLDSAPT